MLAWFTLLALPVVIGPEGSVMAAVDWLLQNLPLSGKRSALQLFFSQPLPNVSLGTLANSSYYALTLWICVGAYFDLFLFKEIRLFCA